MGGRNLLPAEFPGHSGVQRLNGHAGDRHALATACYDGMMPLLAAQVKA